MDNSVYEKYEAVIGLEVHAQLLTMSKAYSPDSTEYGSLPNSNVSPITLGHPGTLPKANKKVVEFAVRLGLACNCNIREYNEYARKNYFYADLPKGYQITQDKTPICTGGHITIKNDDGSEKNISLIRIHMEEDAGKSIHDQDMYGDTLVDLNRAGVPLLEVVSAPDMRTSEEAYKYLTEVRKLVRYLDICDGNMEEGSLRCDANISVRLRGSEKYGQRVEVKNMNSIRNVQRAIESEIMRHIRLIENGEKVKQETRGFDAVKGETYVLRTKEAADDYRYFPEPDLQPVIVTEDYIENVKSKLPALPNELYKKYTKELGLSAYDAGVITDNKQIALYYEEMIRHTNNYKAAANWLTVTVKSFLNERALTIDRFGMPPARLVELIKLVEAGKVSNAAAAQRIFPAMLEHPQKSAMQVAEEMNLIQESNTDSLVEYVKQAIAKYPEKVAEYKGGKVNLVQLFMGEVMKLSKGKADPKVASQLVKEMLDKN